MYKILLNRTNNNLNKVKSLKLTKTPIVKNHFSGENHLRVQNIT